MAPGGAAGRAGWGASDRSSTTDSGRGASVEDLRQGALPCLTQGDLQGQGSLTASLLKEDIVDGRLVCHCVLSYYLCSVCCVFVTCLAEKLLDLKNVLQTQFKFELWIYQLRYF